MASPHTWDKIQIPFCSSQDPMWPGFVLGAFPAFCGALPVFTAISPKSPSLFFQQGQQALTSEPLSLLLSLPLSLSFGNVYIQNSERVTSQTSINSRLSQSTFLCSFIFLYRIYHQLLLSHTLVCLPYYNISFKRTKTLFFSLIVLSLASLVWYLVDLQQISIELINEWFTFRKRIVHESKPYVIFAGPHRKLLFQVNHGGNVNVMLLDQAEKRVRVRVIGRVRGAPLWDRKA